MKFYGNFSYLAGLWIGYSLIGWLLAAFAVPPIIWIGSLIVILHLTIVGKPAIALGQVWVITLFFIAGVIRVWPQRWSPEMPFIEPQKWASILLALWGFVTLEVIGLAGGKIPLENLGVSSKQSVYWLAGVTLIPVTLGAMFYHIFP